MWRLLFISLLALLTTYCERDPNQIISEHRRLIDTLANRQTKLLRPRLDSLCKAEFDQRVALAVDSIIEVRREEERRLRARIPVEDIQR